MIGKGDRPSQRARYRARYRGCRVCGELNVKWCLDCRAVDDILALHWPPALSLIVDGGFVTANRSRPDDPDPARGLSRRGDDGPGHGGAGLVLVGPSKEILASRSCAFSASSSSDAEWHAVIRGARWARGVIIYTDSESTATIAMNKDYDVRFLREQDRGEAHDLAHRLSVEGRSRQELRAATRCSNTHSETAPI